MKPMDVLAIGGIALLAALDRVSKTQVSGEEDKERTAKLEELRFAKKQQWLIATSAVTLLAAIFGIAHLIEPKPGPREKIVGTIFIALIVAAAWRVLWKLQNHLSETRKLLCPDDPNPWFRGVDVLAVLLGAVSLSAYVVGYYVWR
jgi:hypothetical protein